MSHNLSSSHELWVPGQGNDLSAEYPVPPQEQILEKWLEYNPDANTIEAPGVYGVMAKPASAPEVFISLDVCEVMRESHLAIRSVVFANEERFSGNIHKYGFGTCLQRAADYQAVLRALVNSGNTQPVPDIDKISRIIEEAADDGAYIFANTSVLEGAELGTIDFFKKHIPKGLSGVAFPRNHHGTLPLTKGVVFKNVVDEFSDPNTEVFAMHIDDTPHHNVSVRQEMAKRPQSTTVTVTPQYETHLPVDPESELVETPLAAFQAMRRILQSRRND